MDTLLLHSKDLVNLMMKYVTLAQFTPSVWMNDGLNISMVMFLILCEINFLWIVIIV